ncbi:MAG TPA: transketolase [Conexibacter sp.]|jgi:transketolase|nr:transketolase [Conexibacter sp.]
MATAEPQTSTQVDPDRLAVDTIRTLAMDAVQKANSGHPGMPMGMAPVGYLLFSEIMRHNPRDPHWPDRDRFVLSAGHGSMLLYACLHLSGYDLALDDLKEFRQWGSRTPGHPELHDTPGVETTTGPLGQGFGNAVGMALAERFLRERYGAEVQDHRIFGICSDGDLMEGISAEAASIAGHLGLGRLVFLYDDNHISIDGDTALSFDTEDVEARFRAYGWHTQHVSDANDLDALREAIAAGIAEEARPSLIRVRSTIAYGAPTKAGTASAHGAPLGEDEVRATKERFGWDPDKHFFVPDEVYERFSAVERGAEAQAAWEERFAAWRVADAARAEEWDLAWAGKPLPGLADALPSFEGKASLATRAAGGETLQAIAPFLPTMVGGSADLNESVKTGIKSDGPYSRAKARRNVYWGIREHAMGASVNGLALHGGIVRPYGATFLQFADYMRGAVRLSALMRLHVAWVYTHDSVALGEDGPTHQAVEHLAALRAIPGLTVIRPSDAAETAEAWRFVVEQLDGPGVLVLSRQNLPVLDRSVYAPASGVDRGAYVLAEDPDAVATVVGTGSEVSLALEARDLLAGEQIAVRVVAMPSWELFAAQDDAYRASVLPAGQPKVSVEAGIAMGWAQFVDRSVSIERFGASAPGEIVMRELGMTPEAVAVAVKSLLS